MKTLFIIISLYLKLSKPLIITTLMLQWGVCRQEHVFSVTTCSRHVTTWRSGYTCSVSRHVRDALQHDGVATRVQCHDMFETRYNMTEWLHVFSVTTCSRHVTTWRSGYVFSVTTCSRHVTTWRSRYTCSASHVRNELQTWRGGGYHNYTLYMP